jgi:putative exporter of polyketide antibiotics
MTWDSIGLWLDNLTAEQWLGIFLLVMCCAVVLGLSILIERGDA